ncbi:DNA-processing protein DprA [Pseudoduganella chitinolytica]|uniref:DNA-processing protein DprA n=1 Tax=Pseudoduganella chitinolytica TaxID=34070 RepID=A0ABY8B5T2_9BURK|nr:DNA-processing protein DprA [Pseudoduganella chitinolytica]WEF31091.1 DNA-processing protein DprA [Pseudoduganella chitinolytica]
MPATDSLPSSSHAAEEIAAWLRLAYTPGISRLAAARLLRHHGTPQAVLAASHVAPASHEDGPHEDVPRLTAGQAAALRAPATAVQQALLDTTMAWSMRPGHRLLTFADTAYPPLLREIADPPLLLHACGNSALLARAALGIVGSRNATVQGRLNAQRFAHSLAGAGLTIVSGLALGIDAAAHAGALQGEGSTVAVIGTGIDVVYPATNAGLARRIAQEGGCIVSEFALGTPARAPHFPIRNRTISGMTRGVLVVEAAERSGSLITARCAGEQGRDVFAIPGSIHATLSKGCHRLIREGALLVETADDILAALRIGDAARMPCVDEGNASCEDAMLTSLQHAARPLLDALTYDPVGIDELASRLQLDAAATQASLLALELAGVVERLPGGAFQRLKR